MKLETPDLTDKILKPTLETQDLQHSFETQAWNTGLKHRVATQNSKNKIRNPEHKTQGTKLEAKALDVYQRLAWFDKTLFHA